MYALPFVFATFIVNFPAGLIVYWITTNVWTIGQQLLVRKLYPKPEPLDPRDAVTETKPVTRGKPPRAAPAAASDGSNGGSSESSKTKAKAKAGAGDGGPAKPPPQSPRKKKKRSGRRR
jgi:YidC/Oxa1 family membrane protein insertase